ncbi:MAG: discoidin domain-containing protein [Planctomycetota bacterium]
MYKRVFYLSSMIALFSMATIIQAETVSFSVNAVYDAMVANDESQGPDQSSGGSGLHIRDIDVRRRVALVSFDISAVKQEGASFEDVTLSVIAADGGTLDAYGVVEELDNISGDLTWNTAPGVQNSPAPAIGEPVALDPADLSDLLMTFSGIPGGSSTRVTSEPSQALADFINTDTDGIITLLFAPPAGGQLILRSAVRWNNPNAGTFLEGSLVLPEGLATRPEPADGALEVLRDVVLSWTPGEFADKHNVYLGTNLDDVAAADFGSPILVGPGHNTTSFDAGRLDFDQTYFWRVDEVSAPPGTEVFTGSVWSFTTESFADIIPGATIIATASSWNRDEEGPDNTINGSGLDNNDLHSFGNTDMWLSSILDANSAWIQYEFERVHKLHQMLVWNYNGSVEPTVGFGIKEATIEYSVDGTDWSVLGTTHEFARGPGEPGYASNTTVDLGGVPARQVRITANSNWGDIVHQFGLSEIRFLSIPVRASTPSPDSGATDVSVGTILGFRAGREAAKHDIYLSTNEQAVIDGTAPVATVTEASYDPSIDLASTYYWRIDEVNDAETPAIWQGDVWNFTTQEFVVVDDFESYNDILTGEDGSRLVYEIWSDGFADPSKGGSQIGYFTGTSLETAIVHGGSQSVPLMYDNSGAPSSEVTVDPANLSIGRDWTVGSPQVLVLWFHGSPGSAVTEQMYVKVNGAKVVYPGDAADIARPRWKQWNIDLAALGIDLSNVTGLSIGFERTGATGGAGTVFIDDILLYRLAPEVVVPSEEVWVEAESGTVTAPMMLYSDDQSASGGSYVSTQPLTGDEGSAPPFPSGTVTIPFTVAGGTYTARFRVGFPGGDDSCWVRIQDATITSPVHSSGWIHFNDIPTGDFWHWSQEVKSEDEPGEPPVQFALSAGTHDLEISYRGADLRFDVIVFTKVD